MAECKDCKSWLATDAHSGELSCVGCGLVQQEKLTLAECGHQDFFHEGGLLQEASLAAVSWLTSPTKGLPALCQQTVETVKQGPKAGQERRKAGRKVLEEFAHIERIVELLHLPSSVASTAHSFLTICLSKRFERGTTRQATVIACIFHACRAHGAPRTAGELSTVSGVPSSNIKQACKKTSPHLTQAHAHKDTRPEDLMARCCAAIMNDRDQKAARKLLLECKKLCAVRERLTVLQGKTPATVAAVIIWKVVQEQKLPIKKRDVSVGCGVSVGTLVKAEHEYDAQAAETAKRAGNAAASGGNTVKNIAKKGVKGATKALGGGKKKRPRGDMTGLTFVCKAVDFGNVGSAGKMIGPMAPNKGAKGAKGVKAGKSAGKDRRGPRNTPTTGLVAERNLKPSKRRGTR
ncbi:hypothetical protein KFL_007080070 [Klebsormidium nitens]|uniref:Transcription factor TFIIB cyclin-like domain-containing protein n=1 Tax=Klebsormidium nitens TaxID=105231 RepID=A0A1Y1IND5_KLENI|nr:hypothetical protein KFL_007080070 [Klebsormidium nitens]|eukprot:GAQ90969.1 hypothetical protein KFL_007080070 [Klebsormidium nitens]